MAGRNEFRTLMEEYIAFLEESVEREKEKYAALVSYDPKRTDKVVAEQQAANMRLAQLEERREETQRQAGWEGLTFRQILERTDALKKIHSPVCLNGLKMPSMRSGSITAGLCPLPMMACAFWARQVWDSRPALMMQPDASVMAARAHRCLKLKYDGGVELVKTNFSGI